MKLDEITRQAQGMLFFRHMDRISERICDPEYDDISMHVPILHAETLVGDQLDGDEEYLKEVEALDAEYADKERPDDVPPDLWRREKDQYFLRAVFKAACRNGVYSQVRLEIVDDEI